MHPALAKLSTGAFISVDCHTVIFGVILPPASADAKPEKSVVTVAHYTARPFLHAVRSSGRTLPRHCSHMLGEQPLTPRIRAQANGDTASESREAAFTAAPSQWAAEAQPVKVRRLPAPADMQSPLGPPPARAIHSRVLPPAARGGGCAVWGGELGG